MNHEQRNKDTIRRLFAELDGHRLQVIEEVVSEDFVDHGAPANLGNTREDTAKFYGALYSAFPDLRTTLHDLIAEGNKVVVRKTSRGTHTGGSFFGIPPRGRVLELPIINIFELNEHGRITQHWHGLDSALVRQQLTGE